MSFVTTLNAVQIESFRQRFLTLSTYRDWQILFGLVLNVMLGKADVANYLNKLTENITIVLHSRCWVGLKITLLVSLVVNSQLCPSLVNNVIKYLILNLFRITRNNYRLEFLKLSELSM